MTVSVTCKYRGYRIDAEQDDSGWRLSSIIHAWTKLTIPVSPFCWPDAAAAQKAARALVDATLWTRHGVPRRRRREALS
jgi:hypothetical protein